MAATQDQDMSNDECNCVMVVKDVTDEVFSPPRLLKIAAEQQFCPPGLEVPLTVPDFVNK